MSFGSALNNSDNRPARASKRMRSGVGVSRHVPMPRSRPSCDRIAPCETGAADHQGAPHPIVPSEFVLAAFVLAAAILSFKNDASKTAHGVISRIPLGIVSGAESASP